MDISKPQIKISFITGLKEIVLHEISQYKNLHILKAVDDFVYLDFVTDFTEIVSLRSISCAYVIIQNFHYNPSYISNHKSILGTLIETIVHKNKFKTFKIICAGSDSPEVHNISTYIQKTYGLIEKDEADMKIHIIKNDGLWEIGIQITPRPLSLRDYKIENMSGAMDPTIAYAVNSLCQLENADTYLNIFSGSATLLIEAAQCYPDLKKLVGFDNNKKHISLAIQNIRKSGQIKRIQLNEEDIFTKPDLGKFDVITSDLPFGMSISKNENLENVYKEFIDYCEDILKKDGVMCVYTSEHAILKRIINKSNFIILKTVELKFITSIHAYLRPKIFVCKFK